MKENASDSGIGLSFAEELQEAVVELVESGIEMPLEELVKDEPAVRSLDQRHLLPDGPICKAKMQDVISEGRQRKYPHGFALSVTLILVYIRDTSS